MKKGFSIVVTSTHSGKSRYFFISRYIYRIILIIIAIVVVVGVFSVVNYSRIYYQALETVILKRRNLEIEREFAKIQEIKENLKNVERNHQKIKAMLGVEQTPGEVEPVINEVDHEYSEHIASASNKEENIPSILPTIGEISRSFTEQHRGIDIAAPRFSPVVAAASGIVQEAGWDSIYGNYVIIEHNIHYSTFYGHLNSIAVQQNTKVTGGEILGTIGSTGRSTSPHLHYEVRFAQKAVDPSGYLPFVLNLQE
ncbi:M23 family metallopeptidase [candidate division WOR-3 bacterium]|nr:M23 family metallopeptidase [candidate division WOR-3 bacterium]